MASILLVGCDTIGDFFAEPNKVKLTGQRVSVLSLDRRLEPDPALSAIDVRLPQPFLNPAWPEVGGYPDHAMQHLALGDGIKEAWRANIGEGASRYGKITTQPVVADGRVYAMDAEGVVTAVDEQSGRRLWKFDPKPEKESNHAFGGGVAASGDRIYVSTGYAQVVAVQAATGKEIWRQTVSSPMRGAPTVADGRVFAVTVENQLEVLAADDGHRLWAHNGIPETAGLLGAASPAVEGDIVVVAYSSGEIFALRIENGRPLWTDNLSTARPLGALATLADIHGAPVIDRGRVYAVSHSGRMVAIDLRTGDRVWEQDIGGTHGAWVAGDFVYVLSNDNDLICLTRQEGRVRWVRELPRYENEEKKRGPLRWTGPVLGSDRLIVVSSNGEAFSVSPYTGKPIGRTEFPDGVFIEPVLANKTLFVLTDQADLIAMR
jgi:outer membrane protein assembly factor BamB